jgi:hypothetical protein
MDFQRALAEVYKSLEVVNSLRPTDDAIAPSPDVVLVGDGGRLDSLALITMVLAIEREVGESAGRQISLFNESDFESQLTSFRTPKMIAGLILEKLANDEDSGRIGLQR